MNNLPQSEPPMTFGRFVSLVKTGGPGERVRAGWGAFRGLPYGKRLFSKIIGYAAPYSGSIGAEVQVLEPGYALVTMGDRRPLRNHLRCLHAIALCNLAEFTGNIALAYSLPGDARFIVTRMEMEYFHKARQKVSATCAISVPGAVSNVPFEMQIDIHDQAGVLVARGTLFSLLGQARNATRARAVARSAVARTRAQSV